MEHLPCSHSFKLAGGAILLALAFGMTGCAAPPSPYNASGSVIANTDGQAVGANLNGFLSQSTPGQTLVLQQSPWGANVEVMAERTYFAASGRECRHLQVMRLQSSQVSSAVACKTADGSWTTQRLVTQLQAGGNRW